MQLVANAATAANNGGGGTGAADLTPILDELARVPKVNESLTYTNASTNGTDTVTINR